MRRLLLLRHAKSEWPNGIADPERPLAPRGRAAAPRMGAYLAREKLLADKALISPARRTRETWDLLSSHLTPLPLMATEPRIYEAPVARLLTVLREQTSNVQTLMLVGHNPGLEELSLTLCASGATDTLERLGTKFPTGALAVIDLPVDDWQAVVPSIGRLDRFITPRELPENI
ncbi:MAG: histidine phosphatase family protein [Xanthobacter sp.]